MTGDSNPPDALKTFRSRHAFLEDDLQEVRRVMDDAVSAGDPLLDGSLAALAGSPGKMLRSSLVLLGARLGEFDREKAIRAAAAIELLHLATLIHDDIVDSSPLRRGVPTLHTTNGIRKAVLAGDYILTRCFGLIADFASPETASLLASGVGRLCESELRRVPVANSGLRNYKRKAAGKTASLFLMAAYAGARVAESPDSVFGAVRSYGYALGMGFQIVDDILDYGGASGVMGKPVGKDSGEGLITLPLILAAERDPEGIMGVLERPLTKRRAAKVRRRVVEAGGLDAAREYAEEYTRQAVRSAGSLPDGPAKDALVDLAITLGSRDR
jgi:heptaprenyl diphosphate synthase